jgi:hypothetical protein
MDSFQIERMIYKISCGKIFTEQELIDNSKIKLILYSPTDIDMANSSFVYENEYSNAILMNILTEKELMCWLVESEQWSVENNIKIESIKNDIHKITKGLLDFILNNKKLEQARLMLRKAEKALFQLINERNKLLINSAENYASLQQQRYIISKVSRHINGNLLWDNEFDFENEQNLTLINKLCRLFFEESKIHSKTLRLIARSNPWKMIWTTSKNMNMFDTPPMNWTDNQRGLIYWSNIYDNILESSDKPTNKIIEDDDLLDSWFIRQGDKMESQCNKNNINNILKDNNKPGRKEMYIVTDDAAAKDIYSMNDASSRIKIKAKQKILTEKGEIKEQHTPEGQEEMRIQLNKQLITKGKK